MNVLVKYRGNSVQMEVHPFETVLSVAKRAVARLHPVKSKPWTVFTLAGEDGRMWRGSLTMAGTLRLVFKLMPVTV